MRDAAAAVNPELLVLCHGGPIAEPDDAAQVLANTTGVVGFFGASSMERLPTERAIAQLKTWRILRKLRCCPHKAGRLAKAIHVLQDREISAATRG